MRYLFYTLTMCLALVGCESKESQAEHDAKIAKEARDELLAEMKAKEEAIKAQEENTMLYKIGISKEGPRITIDTNKTKTYFDEMGKVIAEQAKQFAEEIKKGEAGIEANQSQVTIDLNKTSDFLDNWAKKMENFAESYNFV